jgi:hypothetical protein
VGEPLLEDAGRLLGPDHPDTLTSRNNLAAEAVEMLITATAYSSARSRAFAAGFEGSGPARRSHAK